LKPPALAGGAFTLGSFPGVLAGASADAHAAVLRLDVGPAGYEDNYEGFDFLVYLNLTAAELRRPLMGVGQAGYAARFLDGGVGSKEVFGGDGPGILEGLEAWGTYATLVPEESVSLTFGFTPETTSIRKTVSLPSGRGSDLSQLCRRKSDR
jgi:hypothetical protein